MIIIKIKENASLAHLVKLSAMDSAVIVLTMKLLREILRDS